MLSQATSEHDVADTISIDSFVSSHDNSYSDTADQNDSVSNVSASISAAAVSEREYSSQTSHYMAVVLYDYQVCLTVSYYHPKLDRSELDHQELDHPEIDHPDLDHQELDHPEIDHPELEHPELDHPKLDHPELNHLESDHEVSTVP